MKRSRVGIVTHYYRSVNYGGNLQAYALVKYIESIGCKAEQISYCKNENNFKVIRYVKRILVYFKNVLKNCDNIKEYKRILLRKRSVLKFNKGIIKHSKEYTDRSIKTSLSQYDIYITGSDQVWHPNATTPVYRLEFVQNSQKKIAYAASIAKTDLTLKELEILSNSLKDYNAISVRETEAVDLLRNISDKEIKLAVDPVFLLERTQWDDISSARLVDEKYVFCYFLGLDKEQRKIAEKYSREHNLKLVNIPYLCDEIVEVDKKFGDYKLSNVSPKEFISLIRNSEIVFTDSFHATAFASIYEKKVIVFERKSMHSMGSRIRTLVSLLGIEEVYCDTLDKEKFLYVSNVLSKDIKYDWKEMFELIKESKTFLDMNLQSE